MPTNLPYWLLNWVQTHLPPWVLITLVIHFAILGTVAYLILLERKIASWVQDRYIHRVGPRRLVRIGLLLVAGPHEHDPPTRAVRLAPGFQIGRAGGQT